MGKPVKQGTGSWVLLLVGLPFFAVGIGMGIWVGHTLLAAHAMKSWPEVPATITITELRVSHGDKSTSYCATASYRYSYMGKIYEGNRVTLMGGSDNIGSFQQRAHAELSRYQQSGKPFRCFVNPANPEQSILYRDPRWEQIGFLLIFVLVFGGVGLGIIVSGAASLGKGRHAKMQKTLQPDKPWTWKQDWAQGVIISSNRTEMWAAIVVTSFWNVIALPVAFMVLGDVMSRKTGALALLVLIFPAIGLGLLAWMIRSIAKWRKFGESRIEMASTPGVIGGALGGAICVPVHIRPEDGFHLKLTCVNRVTTGSGKHRSTTEHVLWQDERLMKRELLENDRSRSAIPVLFGIPYDCRPTDDTDSNNEFLWRLEAKAAVPGIDYQATFDVPVFRTEASSPDFKLDESAIAPYEGALDPTALFKESGIRVEPLAGGAQRIYFAAARNVGSAIGLTIFFAIWTGFLVLMVRLHAPLLFLIVFGLVDVFVFYGMLRLWFASWLVQADRNGLLVTARFLGMERTRKVGRSEIVDIKAAPGMQSGNTQYFDIKVTLQDGKDVTAGARVASQLEAKAIIRSIKTALRDESFSGGQKLASMAKSIPVE